MNKPRIAFLGLGIMGGGMARNLLTKGFPLTVFNRNAEKSKPFASDGAHVANSPREAAERAEIIVSMVADDIAARSLWLGEVRAGQANGALAGAKAGTICIECSTVTAGWIHELAAAAQKQKCEFLDAPVTGSKNQAAAGELNFLVGGDSATLEKMRPVFSALGKNVTLLGPIGSGALVKLINNFVCGVQIASLAEALAVIERSGLDRTNALEVLTGGAPGSPLMKAVSTRMTAPDFTPNFLLRLMAKDLGYAIQEGGNLSVELLTATAALKEFQRAIAAGHGDKDIAAIVEPFRKSQVKFQNTMSTQPVLIAGQWRAAKSSSAFNAENPATGEKLPEEFPTSVWADCDDALNAAAEAANILRTTTPEQIAKFLTRFAERIEARKNEIVEIANLETALPKAPRLAEVELPRTTNQLRQAAAAALEGSWALPTIDTKINIRSLLAPLGPVLIFGPNNFPFAYNGIGGGDFAAAIAAGNPVIAKAHPNHPNTSRLLAEEAVAAVRETNLPPATVQMIYNIAPEDGLKMAADKRLGAIGFTGSRAAGMKLKSAADAVGKPVYLEMSSLNPVVILPGALAERGAKIVEEFSGSCLMAGGQFCTSPGLIILFAGDAAGQFIAGVKAKLESTTPGTLLSSGVARNLAGNVKILQAAGAELVTGGSPLAGNKFANTLLRVSGEKFLAESEKLQTEAFGNASLIVVVRDANEAEKILSHLEGNLTGCVYSDTRGADDALYDQLAPLLRSRVGRLLDDKMPTGVAVSPAMNHGGPYPSTGHPGFTAVGIPASLRRFAALHCYDNVRATRLPAALQNKSPNGKMWRLVDGNWSQADIAG